MYSFFPCNEFHQVKSNMYVSALVCTSIYWYGQVHTSQELVCTGTDQYKPVHTGMYLHKRIYDIITTGIYWYSPTESVMYPFKKKVSKTRTRDFPHTVRRISPCTTGVYTLTLECRPILFWVYIDICIICAPRAWCCIDGAGPAAPCWARNMWQFNNLYFTQLSTQLSRFDTCCWRDLSVSPLCWNSDVLQPMLCVAYVRCELCKQSAQQPCMIPKILKTRLAYVVECDEKAWALRVRYESR